MTSSGVSWPPLKAQLPLTVLLHVFSGLCEEAVSAAPSSLQGYGLPTTLTENQERRRIGLFQGGAS